MTSPRKPGEQPGNGRAPQASLPPVVSHTLANGLRLLILEKHFAPTVSFTLVFKAGNVDNGPGKTGLAHLLEHMAFKGTRLVNTRDYTNEKKALDLVEAAAGGLIAEQQKPSPDRAKLADLKAALEAAEKDADKFIVQDEYWKIYTELGESGMNAMTSTDFTAYVVSLPSNRLEAWMALESDRFRNAVLREFYRERSVVMEERRMGESEPNRLMWEALLGNAFSAHPYRNPTIGWMDDLERLTRRDAEEFFRRFYAPNNATLAVAGDVSPSEVIRLAEKYFAGWERRDIPDSQYTEEPEQKAEKRVNVFFRAQPMLRMGFHNPGISDPDYYALMMAGEILSNGKTSRFYRGLVEGRGLALYANAFPSVPGDRYPSLFVIAAAPRAPHTAAELEEGITAELERLKSEPPTRWELEKIINNYEAEMIKQLESNQGLTMSLAHNQQVLGDWRHDWNTGARLRGITPADVSRAAARYFTRSNRTVVVLADPGSGEAA